jgi:heme oxygenase
MPSNEVTGAEQTDQHHHNQTYQSAPSLSERMHQTILGPQGPHREIANHPFINRYKRRLTLDDHYLHLYQLLHIYRALEQAVYYWLGSTAISHFIDQDHELIIRSQLIEQDLDYIESTGKLSLPAHKLRRKLAKTEDYEAFIKNLDQPERALGHFAVRILGDMHGGQQAKQQVSNLYNRLGINRQAGQGVKFYCFAQARIESLNQRLDELRSSSLLDEEQENKFIDELQLAFEWNGMVFDDVEDCRQSLFNSNKWNKGLTFFAAAAGAGVAALSVYNRYWAESDQSSIDFKM